MKKINWLKISGIVAVTALVIISMVVITLFLRKLPEVSLAQLLLVCITMIATVSGIYYISKTQYGAGNPTDKSESK